MEHLEFSEFSIPVNEKFIELCGRADTVLYHAAVDFDELYEYYQSLYPTELNKIHRVRRHYDGSYDRNYIRRIGDLVAVNKNGDLETIWDVTVPGYFQAVADGMSAKLKNAPFKGYFLTKEATAGSKPNVDNEDFNVTWTHFYSDIPAGYRRHSSRVGTDIGLADQAVSLLKRSFDTVTLEGLETVEDLINSGSLYRGSENLSKVQSFKKAFLEYEAHPHPSLYLVATAWSALNPAQINITHFKNSSIGSLVEAISHGENLEAAVAAFERMVAPTNYRRTTAVVTPRMVETMVAKLDELGLRDSIQRAHTSVAHIPVTDLLFTATNKPVIDALDEALASATARNKKVTGENILWNELLTKVLPSATSVEVLFTSSLTGNLGALLNAAVPDSRNIFKWKNNFSWTYKGGVTDAIQERVKNAGGSIDGVLRVSLAWHNTDDLDLSVHRSTVGRSRDVDVVAFYNRKAMGATLDVDANAGWGSTTTPVENIVWVNAPVAAEYIVQVNNYSKRNASDQGFTIQVAANGTVTDYHYANNNVREAKMLKIEVSNHEIKVTPIIAGLNVTGATAAPGVEVWGLQTGTFVPVNAICYSPNYWDDNKSGHKHVMFFLDGCKADDDLQGLFNEFLNPELNEHRKAFELVGQKAKVAPTKEQAAGVFFSTDVRKEITVRVNTGKGNKVYNVTM